MAGLYFEEFEVGREFHHEFSRTVTEMDNTMFSLLTMNPQPLHIDAHFSEKTEFGQRLFNSLYTLGIMIGMSVYDTTLGTTIASTTGKSSRATASVIAEPSPGIR